MSKDNNAPPHASRMTKTWKENYNNIKTLTWPAQCPDINIIENIWLLLKNQVKRHMMNIDTVGLKAELQHTWLYQSLYCTYRTCIDFLNSPSTAVSYQIKGPYMYYKILGQNKTQQKGK